MVVRSLFVWLSRVFSVWLLHWCLLTLSGGDVTHCHIVSLRRSPSSNTIKRVWGGGISLLSVAVIYPNICPSSWHISVHARLRYLDKVQRRRELSLCPCLSVDGAITWEPVAILSLWCCSPSPPRERERERERPGALQSFSVLIFITEQKHIVFRVPQCHSIHVIFIVHFSDMTLGRLFFCAVGWTVN